MHIYAICRAVRNNLKELPVVTGQKSQNTHVIVEQMVSKEASPKWSNSWTERNCPLDLALNPRISDCYFIFHIFKSAAVHSYSNHLLVAWLKVWETGAALDWLPATDALGGESCKSAPHSLPVPLGRPCDGEGQHENLVAHLTWPPRQPPWFG